MEPNAQDGRGRVFEHLHAGTRVHERLRATVDHCEFFRAVYARTSRVKTPERFLSKIKDRVADGRPTYTADSVTDTVGLKLITHYHDEIPDVVRHLLSLIVGTSSVQPNHFRGARLVELIRYVPHTLVPNDPFTAELQEIFREAYAGSTPCDFEEKPRGGYSSVHMVLRVESDDIRDCDGVGVEIQIRSVFEDAWGEIEHRLVYEQKRRLDDQVEVVQRDSLKKHLTVLKQLLDAAASYADTIKSTLVLPAGLQMSVARSLDETDYIDAFCTAAHIQPSVHQRVKELMSAKRTLDRGDPSADDTDTKAQYIGLAEEFARLVSDVDVSALVNAKTKLAGTSLRVILALEGALCRLLTQDRPQVRLAVAQYRSISKEQPANPICWFRLGQALAFLAVEAIPGSREAEALVAEFSAAYETAAGTLRAVEDDSSPQDVHVSAEERSVIKANLWKVYGFALWRVSDLKRKSRIGLDGEDVRRIAKAHRISVLAIPDAPTKESRLRLINNALYFGADARVTSAALGARLSFVPRQKDLEPLFRELMGHCEASADVPMGFWDTIVHAAVLLKERQRGRAAASKVMDANADARSGVSDFGSSYAQEMRMRAVQFAWTVLRE